VADSEGRLLLRGIPVIIVRRSVFAREKLPAPPQNSYRKNSGGAQGQCGFVRSISEVSCVILSELMRLNKKAAPQRIQVWRKYADI